ncbi:Hint domain protein [Phaeobacter inhibens]|nr:Hint domain protein [Phaeobacter inhibens]AUQ81992.1 Hint domain protein [Phaeobacter inhibens]AUQ89715.1 Hint domain protein [Phaeobacter inhibens]
MLPRNGLRPARGRLSVLQASQNHPRLVRISPHFPTKWEITRAGRAPQLVRLSMLTQLHQTPVAAQTLPVYAAADFCVEIGANMGDSLGVYDDLQLDDVYQLTRNTPPRQIGLTARPDGRLALDEGTATGTPGARLHLDCLLTLMPDIGANVEALVIVEVDEDGLIAAIYLLPLAPLRQQTGYTLVRKTREGTRQRLAQLACVSFTRGTHITLDTGAQRPIEDLVVGDRVLTRDDGAQDVRWIGQCTSRAVGEMAPILIRAGALNNENDLLVSPDHRLLVHPRRDIRRRGRPDHLVRARELVNGIDIFEQSGGFVDYFQLLFDRHQIVFAEGIAAESLLLNPLTRAALPQENLSRTPGLLLGHQRVASGLDIRPALMERGQAVAGLKRRVM